MKDTNVSELQQFSLLVPDPDETFFEISPNTRCDLSVEFLAENIGHSPSEKKLITDVLTHIPTNPKTIAYRNDIYHELSSEPELCSKLHDIFSWLRDRMPDHYIKKSNDLMVLVTRLTALRSYAFALTKINELISGHDFHSEGLKKLKKYVAGICEGSGFEELGKDIGYALRDIDNVRSVTLGVNLDSNFNVIESGLVSINSFYFTEESVLKNFVKFHRNDKFNDDNETLQFKMTTHRNAYETLELGVTGTTTGGNNMLMTNLNNIITRMLPSTTSKVKKIIDKYADLSGKVLIDLTDEFLFYTRFIELEKRIKNAGLPVCTAETSSGDSEFTNLYNIKLAICHVKGMVKENIVCNDLSFTKERNIHILTGPNRGGKTIITQALGLAFIMYQAGVFTPASAAKLRPCSGIYSHFPVEEEKTVSLGRLGEESARFNEICKTADSNSLILFNESFATTSHTESLYIAEDVIKYLCCLGTRAFFNTHMHELAEHAEDFGKMPEAVCGADSLVMENENGKRSYKMVQKKPDGQSYAHEIAHKYGITFEQLSQNLRHGSGPDAVPAT